MHIATIAQTAHDPSALGWTHFGFPGKTLVHADDGFFLEDKDGNRQYIAGNRSLPRDGWEAVKGLT